jgi:hypothetical protein
MLMRVPIQSLVLLSALLLCGCGGDGSKPTEAQSVNAAGVSVPLPDGWVTHDVAASTGGTVILISKHPEPYPRLNPAVRVLVQPLEAGSPSPKNLMERHLGALRQQHRDLSITTAPEDATVGGHAACHAVVRYSATDPATRQSTTGVRHVWVVPRSTDFVAIVMTGPASGEDSSDSLFQRIISDVRIR